MKRLGVAFGSSFLGFPTHFGFLRGLIAGGSRPEAVAGSSTGAIVAALYAAAVPFEQIEAAFTQRYLRHRFLDLHFPLRALGTLFALRGVPAMLNGAGLSRILKGMLGERRIEDCTAARLHLAVTNLRHNRVELRDRGPLVETLLASCALPGFLSPRQIGGELLWDGGLGSSVPVEQWIDEPTLTHVVAHSIIHDQQLRARARPERFNFPAAMLAGHQLAADEALRWKLELARRSGKKTVHCETVTMRPRIGLPLSFPAPGGWPAHARMLIAAGEKSAVRALAELNAGETPIASC